MWLKGLVSKSISKDKWECLIEGTCLNINIRRQVRVFDRRDLSQYQYQKTSESVWWKGDRWSLYSPVWPGWTVFAVAGGGWWHVSPGPGCWRLLPQTSKQDSQIQLSCCLPPLQQPDHYPQYNHLLVTADIYLDIWAQFAKQWPFIIAENIGHRMWLRDDQFSRYLNTMKL